MVSANKLLGILQDIKTNTKQPIVFYKRCEKLINENPEYRKCIVTNTSGLDSSVLNEVGYDISLYQRIYYFVNGIKDVPKCKVCGKPLRFIVKKLSERHRGYIIAPFENIRQRFRETPTHCSSRRCSTTYSNIVTKGDKNKLAPQYTYMSIAKKTYKPIKSRIGLEKHIKFLYANYKNSAPRVLVCTDEYVELVLKYTKFIDDNKLPEHPEITIWDRIHALRLGMKEIPKCKVCGKTMRGDTYIYRARYPYKYNTEYCGASCRNIYLYKTYPEFIEIRKKGLDNARRRKRELKKEIYGL